jgi:TusA-related sulfurtransferase
MKNLALYKYNIHQKSCKVPIQELKKNMQKSKVYSIIKIIQGHFPNLIL